MFFINALYAGAGKIILFVAETCVKMGWQVTVATFYDDGICNYKLEGVRFVDLAISTDKPLWRIQALKIIRNFVRENSPSIVCSFISDVVVMTRLATLGLSSIFVAAERGDPYTLPSKWVRIVKWAYSKSNFTVFQLKGAQDFFGKKIRQNSCIIPNPYSTGNEVKPFVGNRKKTIVTVGRFVEQKGYDVLLKAYALFAKKHPEYKLIIYGDGPLKQNLLKLACELGIKEKVDFPGFISNVPQRISDDGVFVLSSRFEGIPNTMIEAMSVGLPVVATDCTPGGPRFLTDNGRRGILVPVDDAEALAEGLFCIVEHPKQASCYSELGLEIVKELNPRVISGMWMKVFEELIKY